jgi:hypothetical protein
MNVLEVARECESQIYETECPSEDRDVYIAAMAGVDGLFKTWRESRNQTSCPLEGYFREWYEEFLGPKYRKDASPEGDSNLDQASASTQESSADTQVQQTRAGPHNNIRQASHSAKDFDTSMDVTGIMRKDSLVKDTAAPEHPNPPQVSEHTNPLSVDEDTGMNEDTNPQVDASASITHTAQGYGSQTVPRQQ